MKENEIVVGKKVKVVDTIDGRSDMRGWVGTVVAAGPTCSPWDVGIEFPEPIRNGHDAHGYGREGYCYFGWASDIEYVQNDINTDDLSLSFDDVIGKE